jgi:hypothetical protein
LVTGGLGRRWKLTPLGERFLAAPAPLQVWLLLATWWTQTDWAIASPYDFEGRNMPTGYSRLILKQLLELPLGKPASFDRFADQVIEDSRLVWGIQDQVSARRILSNFIECVVIYPLVDFGILLTEYEPHKTLGAEFRELSTFRITPFGKGLLEAIIDEMNQKQPRANTSTTNGKRLTGC